MFSDNYKKDNKQISLDDDFIKQLSKKMKNECENQKKSTTNQTDFIEIFSTSKEKKTFIPGIKTALCTCVTLLILTCAIPYMKPLLKHNKDSLQSNNQNFDIEKDDSLTKEALPETSQNTPDSNTSVQKTNKDPSTPSDLLDKDTNSQTTKEANSQIEQPLEVAKEEFKKTNDIETSYHDTILSLRDVTLDLHHKDTFIPSDEHTLSTTIDHMLTLQKGADYPTLDYAFGNRVILHDYWGFIVYNRKTTSIERAFSLKDRIGIYQTQGDEALNVNVFEGGNYVLFSKMNATSSDANCFIYNVQTDQMVTLTKKELELLNPPRYDTNIDTSTSAYDGLLPAGNRSIERGLLNDTQACILFFQVDDWDSIASLSLLISPTDMVNKKNIEIYPVFGDHGRDYMKNQNHQFNAW